MECGGWIKLHRKITESAVFQNPLLLKTWVWCLCHAVFKECDVIVDRKAIHLMPGEVIVRQRELADELEINRITLKRYISLLEELQMVCVVYTKRYTKLMVSKWEIYQCDDSNSIPNCIPNSIPNCIPNSIPNPINKNDKERKECKEIKECKEKIFETFAENNSSLLSALQDFEEMRNKIRRPLTDRAKQMLITALVKLSADTAEQIEILNQSTMNCWQSVFALKNKENSTEKLMKELREYANG